MPSSSFALESELVELEAKQWQTKNGFYLEQSSLFYISIYYTSE